MLRNEILAKRARSVRRAKRTRSKIHGSASCPRLSIFRSEKHMTAQLINDDLGKTLFAASDLKMKAGKPLERAAMVGAEIAKAAKAAGITKVIFDRGSFLYHGRVKALADSAREHGLQF